MNDTHRKRRIALLFLMLTVLSLFLASAGACTEKESRGIPVLTYHRVVKHEVKMSNGQYRNNKWVNDLDNFESNMKYLHDNGYRTLSMDEFYDWYRGKLKVNEDKTVVITFDDGNAEDYYNVLPVMKKYGLRGTCFVIGENMLGIIGTNGAGKSTLLKAVSGIMVPTEGAVVCRGKIAALLELGSGFDGDMTVKENTYLRGAMLGYTKKFMDDTYDDIIAFAELTEFQDRPFKQLSSGMKSRLAFSIASLVNPDILILDEVLSVGDGAFRKKSEEKMRSIINGGATTILVSHSIPQVRSMCNKILWLDHGRQVTFGDDVNGICDLYEKYLADKVLPEIPAGGSI